MQSPKDLVFRAREAQDYDYLVTIGHDWYSTGNQPYDM